MAEPKWKRFERLVHELHKQFAPPDAVVTLDDTIIGAESKVERQLDVTIRTTVAQYQLLIVIECKDGARPIDVATMGGFASLLRDVKANKGVMISTSGYTPAAVEMARAQGIDTRTYLDTENIDWKSEVSIPVLIISTKLVSWYVRFSSVPGFPMAAPTDSPFPFIETFAVYGEPLGPIITLLGRKWHHDESLHEPGEHRVLLGDHVLIDLDGKREHAKLEAFVRVERHNYLGPLPIEMVGFRDEQNQSISTNKMTSQAIDASRIERGEIPGWREVPSDKDIAINAVMVLHLADALPENSEEMQKMGLSPEQN
jgi:hypothetical protein